MGTRIHGCRDGVHGRRPGYLAFWALCIGTALALLACAGHAESTQGARTALDAGNPRQALKLLNERLEVDSEKELPDGIENDQILYVLDRAMVEQQLDMYEFSSRDLQAADKHVELLDFTRGTGHDIAKFLFSDDSGPYAAPAYEKLLINTMNMMNYVARGDLSGARVEARRFATMQKFISERDAQAKALSAPGSYLAGFIFEKSGQAGEALRYYDEALQISPFSSLADPVRRLARIEPYRTPRITSLIEGPAGAVTDDDSGEVLVIVNYGRVPAKIAERVPIGLALTMASTWMSPANHAQANRLAAQGLVTWINYPTLGKPRGTWAVPYFAIDQVQAPLDGLLAVDQEAQATWKNVQGQVIASAITRMITRIIAGEAARAASGGGTIGAILSLGTQATMTAVDTPDTRSWATLPARIAFGRQRLSPGAHTVVLQNSGIQKKVVVNVQKGSWAVVILTVLR
jgi:uncharacterized protein